MRQLQTPIIVGTLRIFLNTLEFPSEPICDKLFFKSDKREVHELQTAVFWALASIQIEKEGVNAGIEMLVACCSLLFLSNIVNCHHAEIENDKTFLT